MIIFKGFQSLENVYIKFKDFPDFPESVQTLQTHKMPTMGHNPRISFSVARHITTKCKPLQSTTLIFINLSHSSAAFAMSSSLSLVVRSFVVSCSISSSMLRIRRFRLLTSTSDWIEQHHMQTLNRDLLSHDQD